MRARAAPKQFFVLLTKIKRRIFTCIKKKYWNQLDIYILMKIK